MTNREFFNAIISASINDELTAHAQASLDALDKRNVARNSATATKRKAENEPIVKAILGFLADKESVISSEIASAIGVTTYKVVGVASSMRNDGVLDSCKVKVKGKGEQTAWFIPKGDVAE